MAGREKKLSQSSTLSSIAVPLLASPRTLFGERLLCRSVSFVEHPEPLFQGQSELARGHRIASSPFEEARLGVTRKPKAPKKGKERKPHVVALRLSERTYDDLVLEADKRGMSRGTLAALLLEKALRDLT